MRILLLEDEEAIRGFVRINLKRNGMEVAEAEDGETALALAEAASPPFDAALLDVMLPTISGFEVCERLRGQFPRMGIIMLTAKSQEEDKILGLELGADDYIQKPFSPGELIARLKALHRRMMPGGLSWPDPASTPRPDGPDADAVRSDGAEDQASEGQLPAEGADLHVDGRSEAADAAGAGQAEYHEGGREAGVGEAYGTVARGDVPEDAGAGPAERPAAVEPEAGVGEAHGAAPGEGLGSAAAGAARVTVPGYKLPLSDLYSGPFRLSAVERRLWKDNEEIVLTPTEWTLVKLLLEREGAGLSRDDILDAVWGRHFVGDLKIVDVNIRRIRQKIEDEPSEPKYIETLWGFGYRWKRSEGR